MGMGTELTTCDECGEMKPDVFQGLCDECSEESVFCRLCDCWQDDDGHCRHVFRASDGCWHGSGADHYDPEFVKPGVLRWLDKFSQCVGWESFYGHTGNLIDLIEDAISGGHFHTFFHGFIGEIKALTLCWGNGVFAELGSRQMAKWYDEAIRDWDVECEMRDGYGWLQSLYESETPEANVMTAEWIREWKALEGEAAEWMRSCSL